MTIVGTVRQITEPQEGIGMSEKRGAKEKVSASRTA